ncbi:hypothetical protein SteCoe_34462 [Stentor coeruleus]|uniref:Uncharacterized protein n=1 Tax=Stentor coeruleus TaxID=5963 RepID=A0A1R2AUG2_9CILI|nr:hypothetical protein SteCoe_34462 [Stentor coeruleus]
MTATASLEDYIKQFKQDYKKYIVSETSSVSSIDTEDLLSDMSSEISSVNSKPAGKNSIKTLSSLKKSTKKTKINPPSHMKPLHSTPLKMIQEEDELADSKTKLSNFLPNEKFDINKYLPKARAAKNQQVQDILASLDIESENMSIISSVDTEALLQSSDEEDYVPKKENIMRGPKKRDFGIKPETRKLESDLTKKYSEKDFGRNPLISQSRSGNLSVAKSQVLSIVPKKLTTETLSLSVSSSKRQSRSSSSVKPSDYFNSIMPSLSKNTKTLKICTCVLSGSLYRHYSNCSPLTVIAELGTVKHIPKKTQPSFMQSVVAIQRAIRKFITKKRASKNYFASKTYAERPKKSQNSFFKSDSDKERPQKTQKDFLKYDTDNERPQKSQNNFFKNDADNEKLQNSQNDFYRFDDENERPQKSQNDFYRYDTENEKPQKSQNEFFKLDVDKASKTLNDAYKELEALRNLASERSSEMSKDESISMYKLHDPYMNPNYEPSDVDTEELLNSSISSMISRN